MPANYTITTRSDGETLTAAKYNADHQNHIDHMTPAYIDDYSSDLSQMRSQVDPGETGSESLATSISGELERLRYAVAEIKAAINPNLTYWYQTPYGEVAANVKAYGALGNGVADDTAAIQAAINTERKIIFPPGTYNHTGLTLGPSITGVSFIGAGFGNSILHYTGSGTAINITSTNNSAVEYAGLAFEKMKFTGTSSTGVGIKVKNRVNIEVKFCEFNDFAYAITVAEDHIANSVNSMVVDQCRILNCGFGVYWPCQANSCAITNTQFRTTNWSTVVYNAVNCTVWNNSYNGTYSDSGSGAIWMGGCITCGVTENFCEGDPPYEAFIVIADTRYDGTATLRSDVTKMVTVSGNHFSSAGGTNYGIQINAADDVLCAGNSAGSGMQVACIRATTGTSRCTFLHNHANPAVTVSYQTATDAINNFEHAHPGGSSVSYIPTPVCLGTSTPLAASLGLNEYQTYIHGLLLIRGGATQGLVFRNTAETGHVYGVHLNASDQVCLDKTGNGMRAGLQQYTITNTEGALYFQEKTTAGLQSGGPAYLNNTMVIEDAAGDATNLVYYHNGHRYKIAGVES